MKSPAERIAKLCADLAARRVSYYDRYGEEWVGYLKREADIIHGRGPIVDMTAIADDLRQNPAQIAARPHQSDFNLAPPWPNARLCSYRADTNEAICLALESVEASEFDDGRIPPAQHAKDDWSWARWLTNIFCWASDSAGRAQGPHLHAQFVMDDNGVCRDYALAYISPQANVEAWGDPLLLYRFAIDWLNGSNVHLVEPLRPRAVRRRIERFQPGMKVHEIRVFRNGHVSLNAQGEPVGGVPLSSVRGHWAEYGPKYGKGLLFGKYEGRFWVPQHARGSRDAGENEQTFILRGGARVAKRYVIQMGVRDKAGEVMSMATPVETEVDPNDPMFLKVLRSVVWSMLDNAGTHLEQWLDEHPERSGVDHRG